MLECSLILKDMRKRFKTIPEFKAQLTLKRKQLEFSKVVLARAV